MEGENSRSDKNICPNQGSPEKENQQEVPWDRQIYYTEFAQSHRSWGVHFCIADRQAETWKSNGAFPGQRQSAREFFFFFFGLEMPVFLVYPGLQLIGHGPPTPCTATFFTQSPPIQRRRQRQPTPVLLPGKSHGRMRLVGCNPWGCEESDTTE